MAPAVGPAVLQQSMLPLALRLASDPVPNIRFNVAKTLESVATLLDPSVVQGDIKPVVQKLAEDEDSDVRYFATKALQVM
jgi:serine/threonine-protein phosphatase 2A regulatory subunit A